MPSYEPIFPEGMDESNLASSKKFEDAFSGLLYDEDGNLTTHAAWRLVVDNDSDDADEASPSEDSDDELADQDIAAAVALVALIALATATVIVVAPHVRRWWGRSAGPAIKTRWGKSRSAVSTSVHKLFARKKQATPGIGVDEEPTAPERVLVPVVSPIHSRTQFMTNAPDYIALRAQLDEGPKLRAISESVSPQTDGAVLTRGEWETRFRRLLRLVQQEEWLVLAHARIIDGQELSELQGAMLTITAEQFVAQVNHMLAANPRLVGAQNAADLVRLFGLDRLYEGQFVPLLDPTKRP